jgi:hypothetical protein
MAEIKRQDHRTNKTQKMTVDLGPGQPMGEIEVPAVGEIAWYFCLDTGWIESRVTGYSTRGSDHDVIVLVDTPDGNGRWGYLHQIAVKVDEFEPQHTGW